MAQTLLPVSPVSESRTTAELILPPELTIYNVAELRTAWRNWLDAALTHAGTGPGAPCRADGAAVCEVDAAGLQLLLALSNQLAGLGQELRVHHPSAALLRACDTLGLSALIADDGVTGKNV